MEDKTPLTAEVESKTLDQHLTEVFKRHYGKVAFTSCHKYQVVADAADSYAQYKTKHQRKIIGQLSQQTASLQERVKELEQQLSEKDELMKAHTNLGMHIINAGKYRITELEKDKEKLMGLLEKSFKKGFLESIAQHGYEFKEGLQKAEVRWQSYKKEHGLTE